MVEFASTPVMVEHKGMIALVAVVVLGGALGGYAIHEHRAAQDLAATNAQQTAQLSTTQHELGDLTAKVDELATREQQAQAARQAATQGVGVQGSGVQVVGGRRTVAIRRDDPRFKKLQAQLDEQGKAIDDTRSGLTSTQGDLVNTRTELTGSIAHTHDELVLLEKKGERNYAEFDVAKAKVFKRAGSVELRLKKADAKHQFADLDLMVNDRTVTQKHVNLLQPVMFYMPDSPQPVEIVINDIGKDHIHGYVSSSKYRQSELASMSNPSDNPAQGTDQTNGNQAQPRVKLPPPQ